MQKGNRRMVLFLLFLTFMSRFLSMEVQAAGMIDLNQEVQLTIEYMHGTEPVAGIPFDVYRIASVNEYAEYALDGAFKTYPVKINDLEDEEWGMLAGTLVSYINRDQLEPLAAGKTNVNGNLHFQMEKPGLYLAVGHETVRDGYIYTTEPFLVALPFQDMKANEWSYAAAAVPKFTREELPEDPSEETADCKVIKIWKGDNKKDRPKEIEMQLLKDRKIYDAVILKETNNWRYTWKDLPQYDADGSKISWSVVEKKVENYTVLTGKSGNTFTVTNTGNSASGSTGNGQTGKLPQTGLLWWPVPVLMLAGLFCLIMGRIWKKEYIR